MDIKNIDFNKLPIHIRVELEELKTELKDGDITH